MVLKELATPSSPTSGLQVSIFHDLNLWNLAPYLPAPTLTVLPEAIFCLDGSRA